METEKKKIKTHFAKIFVSGDADKPYFNIMYFDPMDREYHIGFSSYCIENVFEWLSNEFEIIDEQPFMTSKYEKELKIRCAEISELKHHLSNVLDDRTKIGTEYEQALIRIDELNGKIEFLKGQIEAYQYCMNCRR